MMAQLGQGMAPLGQGWGHHSGVTARVEQECDTSGSAGML